MDIRKLQRAIVDGLEDVKGQNIVVFNTEHLSPLFERVIIASGTSNRQTKALASSVRDAVKSKGFPVMRTEGEDNGEWIIVDCGAAVVHLMQPGIRDYYHLEEIWGDKPVRMKLDERPATLVKASSEAPAPSRKAPARRAAADDDTPAKAAARKASSTTTKSATTKRATTKSAATKTAARKTTATKSAARPRAPSDGVSRTVGVKRTAAAKAPAAKKAASRAPAKSAPGSRTAAKKTGATKTAAKKAAPRKAPSRA